MILGFDVLYISPILLGIVSVLFCLVAFAFGYKTFNVISPKYWKYASICSLFNGIIFALFQYFVCLFLPNWVSILVVSFVLLGEVRFFTKDIGFTYIYMVSALIFVMTACDVLVLVIKGLSTSPILNSGVRDVYEVMLIESITMFIATLYMFVLYRIRRIDKVAWKDMMHSKTYGLPLFIYFIVFDISMCATVTLIDPIIYTMDHSDKILKSFMTVMLIVSITLFISSLLIVIISTKNTKVRVKNKNLGHIINIEHESALRDPLTGVLNRRGFEEKVGQVIEEGVDGVLFMFDLDNFKNINDKLGHPKGDELLVDTGDILCDEFRNSDFIGRMGGDEFIVFAPGMEKDVIKKRAKRLNERLKREMSLPGKEMVKTSASIGISMYPNDGDTYEKIYDKADKALYISKNSGKSTFVIVGEENEKF